MKHIQQKKNNGSKRGIIKKNSALEQMVMPALPSGVPDFPKSITKPGIHYERTREIYSLIGHAIISYAPLYQAIDCQLMLMAAVNYKIWEDCIDIAVDPDKRIITEAKSHCAIDPQTGKLPTVLKTNPALKIMITAEESYRNCMNALGLTIPKRASIAGTLSMLTSTPHGNSNTTLDPYSKFFNANELLK